MPQHPDNVEAAWVNILRAEIHGLLGETEAMLPLLRRAITMQNGESAAALLTEPEFMRHRDDTRFQALATPQPVHALTQD